MTRAHHHLKCDTKYYQAVEQGEKKFEIRYNGDIDFKKCDMVHLHETINGIKTGRRLLPVQIEYIIHGGEYGLDEKYCIFNW